MEGAPLGPVQAISRTDNARLPCKWLNRMKYVARDAARLSLHHRSWTGICRVTHLFVISEGDGRPFAREVATDNGKKSIMEVLAKQSNAARESR
jgi:hypothetical protein